MPDTTTGNLGLTKPEIGASADTWGNKINTDLDLVDALFAAAGTGTSVGVNVGVGKVAAIAGTLNVTGAVTGGIVAPLASPTFTGTVVLPSTTSIGPVSSTEIGYLDNVTSNVQTQLDAKLGTAAAASTYAPLDGPTFTGTVTLPSTTSIGGVSAAEIVYLDGVTSNVQTQLDGKAGLASPAFTGTPTAATASTGTNTTQIATTAFVQQVAFNNTLPSQTGNAGKYVTTDGTDASWGEITIPAQVYPSAGIAVSTGTGWGTSLSTPLGVPNGGIGASTLTANNVLLGNGTSALQEVAPGALGNVLTSNGTTWTSTALPLSGPTHTATLSGTLANGATVIVNPDGTVSPAQGPTELLGSSVIFSLYEIQTTDSTYDTANQKIVIVYRDGDNLYYAVVGTVSGTTISFGTPVTFADSLGFTAICRVVYHAAAQKVVIVYTISGSTYSKVGTVSGTSISFGAQVGMPLSITQTDNSAITYDSTNQKIVVIAQSSTYGTACVGTVSGTSISFGSGVDIFSSQVSSATTAMCFDPSTSKVVVASSRSGNGFAAVVGTVSGTSISFGAEITWGFSGATTPQRLAMAYDSFNQKVVIFYKTSLNSTVYAVAATISGTTITLSAASGGLSADTLSRFTASYNVLQNLVCVGIRNTSGFFAVGYHRITGGTPTYVSAVNFTSNATTDSVIAYDPIQEREVGAFNFGSKGRAAVFRYGTSVTNVTAENFIGFSNAAYTNGQTATIQVIGSVDDAQSGLTAGQSYFVMTNGTLSLTAGSPSIFAGTAVSATQIIVKG